MLEYFNAISCEDIIYSVDMVRLKLDFSSEKRMLAFGDFMSDVTKVYVEQYPVSYKAYAYRNMFRVTCANNNSFVIGLSFNGNSKSDYYIGFMEFNPNKVANTVEFQNIYSELRVHCFCAEVVRWDLAVDVPLARDMCVLQKDKRKYQLVQNSERDKTEYLGQRNKSGYVKLYNKTLESDLDYDLTRLELTVPGDCTYKDFITLLPRIDVKGDQQSINPYLDLNGTYLVLYELLMEHDVKEREMYVKRLGRRVAELLRPYIRGSKYDSDKFVVSKESFLQLRKQLREWTINIRYDLLDDCC